jgi:hypothetical protein
VLSQLGLGAIPEVLSQDGTGRAWAARTASGKPLVFVMAETPAALAAMQRSLPHYGRQSWLLFQDARVTGQGAWPPVVPPLALR